MCILHAPWYSDSNHLFCKFTPFWIVNLVVVKDKWMCIFVGSSNEICLLYNQITFCVSMHTLPFIARLKWYIVRSNHVLVKKFNNCSNDFTDIHCKAMVKLGIILEEKTTLGCIGDLRSFNTFYKQFQI